MVDFNDRRKDPTRDWRIGVVKTMMESARQSQLAQEPFTPNYPGKVIPTQKAVDKADKAKARRIARARRQNGL